VYRLEEEPPAIKDALNELAGKIRAAYPGLPNARWVAMRLLGGDDRIAEALRRGELATLAARAAGNTGGLLNESQEPAA
jgi:ferrous iron transport protein B